MNRAVVSAPGAVGTARRLGVRKLNGHDERSIAETRGLPPLFRMLALLQRVSIFGTGESAKEALPRMPLGDCIRLILLLRESTLGPVFACELSCPACGEEIAVSIRVDALKREVPAQAHQDFQLGDFLVRLRPVVARDLDPVFDGHGGPALADDLARSCVVASDPPLPDPLGEDLASGIAAKLGELDSGAETTLRLSCPACKTKSSIPFSVEGFFFQEMDARYGQLERDVHCLAFNYHWTEGAILSLPSGRRKLYVDLIDESLSGGGV
jgi:hypothetical protein